MTRTSSDPASASSMHCCAVAAASAVSVIVIDWTQRAAANLDATDTYADGSGGAWPSPLLRS